MFMLPLDSHSCVYMDTLCHSLRKFLLNISLVSNQFEGHPSSFYPDNNCTLICGLNRRIVNPIVIISIFLFLLGWNPFVIVRIALNWIVQCLKMNCADETVRHETSNLPAIFLLLFAWWSFYSLVVVCVCVCVVTCPLPDSISALVPSFVSFLWNCVAGRRGGRV